MSRLSTSQDMQRATFVESLHTSLKKQAEKAIVEQKKFITIAKSYVEDGLEEKECVELLMIDGLNREAAEGYVTMALSHKEEAAEDTIKEYSFKFDDNGKILCSYDIGKIIKASTEEEAWEKAEQIMNDMDLGASKLLNIQKI